MTKNETAPKCRECGTTMKVTREPYDYSHVLPGVTLESVEMRRCPNCGSFAVGIEHMEALHRDLARSVALRPERLGPKEVHFLRAWLGMTSGDMAKKLGVDKSTASRWESEAAPQPMSALAERVLRLLVMLDKPADEVALEDVATLDAAPVRMRAADKDGQWEFAVSAGARVVRAPVAPRRVRAAEPRAAARGSKTR